MAPKKRPRSGRASSSSGPVPPPWPPINHFNIEFENQAHKDRFELMINRQISEPTYLDEDFLIATGLWDDMEQLLGYVGLTEFVRVKHGAIECLTREFMSSFKFSPQRNGRGDDPEVHFRLANLSFDMSVEDFCLHLHIEPRGMVAISTEYDTEEFWNSITCSQRPIYTLKNGKERSFDARQTKASPICNPVLKYFQRYLAHSIFARGDSQTIVGTGMLFFLWAALNKRQVHSGVFLLEHLQSQAMTSKPTVFSLGGLITNLAVSLGIDITPYTFSHPGRTLNAPVCCRMQLFIQDGPQVRVSHHGAPFFALPDTDRTTINNPANWSYETSPIQDQAGPSTNHREDVPPSSQHHESTPMDVPLPASTDMYQAIMSQLEQILLGQADIQQSLQHLDTRVTGLVNLVHYAYQHFGCPYPPPDWTPP